MKQLFEESLNEAQRRKPGENANSAMDCHRMASAKNWPPFSLESPPPRCTSTLGVDGSLGFELLPGGYFVLLDQAIAQCVSYLV